MAFKGKKRFSKKRRTYGRKMMKKRWSRKSNLMNPGNMQNYYVVKKWGDLQTAVSFSSNNLNGALNFQLADMPEYSKFTDIFDQYKIRTVMVRFRLIYDPATAPLANQGVYPDIFATVDHDDNNGLTAQSQYTAYSKCKTGILKPYTWFNYKLHPSVAEQVYLNTTLSGYAAGKSGGKFIDSVYVTVPHYGLKYGIFTPGGITPAAPIYFQFQVYYDVLFKNAR